MLTELVEEAIRTDNINDGDVRWFAKILDVELPTATAITRSLAGLSAEEIEEFCPRKEYALRVFRIFSDKLLADYGLRSTYEFNYRASYFTVITETEGIALEDRSSLREIL